MRNLKVSWTARIELSANINNVTLYLLRIRITWSSWSKVKRIGTPISTHFNRKCSKRVVLVTLRGGKDVESSRVIKGERIGLKRTKPWTLQHLERGVGIYIRLRKLIWFIYLIWLAYV
jgi:hypothetical protein